jgi:chromosome partitioning protein
MTRVIAVANNKGGVGKTTTAGNLAYGLSRTLIVNGEVRGRVLIVDLDPQGNQADFFGVRDLVYSDENPEGACISALLLDPTAPLGSYMIPLDRKDEGLPRPNLFLIPATAELTNAVEVLANQDAVVQFTASQAKGRAAQQGGKRQLDTVLADRLGRFLGKFEYIILDCPPKLDSLKTAVYHFADEVIVPAMPDKLSLVGVDQHTADLAAQRGAKAKAKLTLVLPTRVDKRQVMARQVLEELNRHYSVADPIPDSVRVKESPAAGRTLFEYAPDCDAALAYANLVRRVING